MLPDPQRWRPNHWLNLWLTEADFSIWTERTTQQDVKSNNTAQDDEQHNATLRPWRNHKKKHKRKHLIYVEITYLDWKIREKRMQMSDFRSKKDRKPPILDEWKKKKLKREIGVSLTEKLRPAIFANKTFLSLQIKHILFLVIDVLC